MKTIDGYFLEAQLSLAAYGNFQPGVISTDALVNKSVGMSQLQANLFVSEWTVVDQFNDPLTGLSATVFEKAGQRYLAVRGTQISDPADLLADAAIAIGGVAANQAVALYNYVQRLQGVKGQPVAQLEWNGVGYDLNPGGAVGLLDTPLSGPVDIAGHSLGGHLAMALGRMMPGVVSHISTYNAPGFNDAVASFFFSQVDAALGQSSSSYLDASTTNLYGSGLNIIAGHANDHGIPQEIFIEGDTLNPINNHKIEKLTDALAVYDLFAKVAPGLDTDPNGLATITGILTASSSTAANDDLIASKRLTA